MGCHKWVWPIVPNSALFRMLSLWRQWPGLTILPGAIIVNFAWYSTFNITSGSFYLVSSFEATIKAKSVPLCSKSTLLPCINQKVTLKTNIRDLVIFHTSWMTLVRRPSERETKGLYLKCEKRVAVNQCKQKKSNCNGCRCVCVFVNLKPTFDTFWWFPLLVETFSTKTNYQCHYWLGWGLFFLSLMNRVHAICPM